MCVTIGKWKKRSPLYWKGKVESGGLFTHSSRVLPEKEREGEEAKDATCLEDAVDIWVKHKNVLLIVLFKV